MESKNILVMAGSPRRGGNSDMLAEAFIRGAESSGHKARKFYTYDANILPCRACNQCYSKGKPCVFEDDFNDMVSPLVEEADVLVLASPLYWFSFTTSLRSAFDKFYSYLVGGRQMRVKELILLTCGVAVDLSEYDGIVRTFEIIAHYKHWKNSGKVVVPGVKFVGDIQKTDGLARAEKLGREFGME